ncbi:hypothetical protein SNEBB_005317 [Seison nebaliae]|nr:hypothetical protein SNEBB_005317 [Seison nebaliae]
MKSFIIFFLFIVAINAFKLSDYQETEDNGKLSERSSDEEKQHKLLEILQRSSLLDYQLENEKELEKEKRNTNIVVNDQGKGGKHNKKKEQKKRDTNIFVNQLTSDVKDANGKKHGPNTNIIINDYKLNGKENTSPYYSNNQSLSKDHMDQLKRRDTNIVVNDDGSKGKKKEKNGETIRFDNQSHKKRALEKEDLMKRNILAKFRKYREFYRRHHNDNLKRNTNIMVDETRTSDKKARRNTNIVVNEQTKKEAETNIVVNDRKNKSNKRREAETIDEMADGEVSVSGDNGSKVMFDSEVKPRASDRRNTNIIVKENKSKGKGGKNAVRRLMRRYLKKWLQKHKKMVDKKNEIIF